MKATTLALAALLGLLPTARAAGAQAAVIEQRRPELQALVSLDEKLERVAGGFGFAEGPVWMPEGGGSLLISDIPANAIYRISATGAVTPYLERSGYQGLDVWRAGMPFNNLKSPEDPGFESFQLSGSNGLARDAQGRLVIATWAGRSIDRIEKGGKRSTLAARYEGKRFGGTNDVVVRRDGSIYFTDMYGGMPKKDKDPSRELPAEGVYALRGGQVSRMLDSVAGPNGLAFSPDEKAFYVSSTAERRIWRYDVTADGGLVNGRLLADLSREDGPGITDGMKVDVRGNLWATGPGGVWVISPAGELLGRVKTPEPATNLAFGGEDGRVVFITTPTTVYRVRAKVAGAGLGQ